MAADKLVRPVSPKEIGYIEPVWRYLSNYFCFGVEHLRFRDAATNLAGNSSKSLSSVESSNINKTEVATAAIL